MQAILSSVITIFYYAMVVAAVWKLFQIASDLGEIKKLLAERRQPATTAPATLPVVAAAPVAGISAAPAQAPAAAPATPPVMAGPISLESAEALLREVEAESHALAAAERTKATA